MLQSSCSLHPTLGVLSAASRSFRPSPLLKKIAVVTSYNLGQNNWWSSELPIPSKMKHEAAHEKVENAPFSIFDWRGNQPLSQGSLPLAAALLRDPSVGRAKEQLSLCRLRRSLATRRTSQDNPKLRSFCSHFHLPVHRFISEVIVTNGRVATMSKRGRWSSHPSVLFHYAIFI